MAYPAMQAQRAQADESPASTKDTLPDLGRPNDRSGTVSVRPNGVTLNDNFDGKRLTVSPEYSNLTGFALNAGFAANLSDSAALGLLFTAGADKKELLFNAAYQLDGSNRILFTLGQLRQNLEYNFLSGNDKAELSQNSGALSYQHHLGSGLLSGIEINAYLSNTGSRDLGSKTYATDTTTLYELWSEPRRIAGGKVTGLQGQLILAPTPGATLKLGFGGERLEYDFYTGKDSANRATGSAEWNQQFSGGYTLNAALGTYAAQERYSFGLDRRLGGGHQIGVKLIEIRGRDGIQNDSQALLAYSYTFGSRAAMPATNQTAAWNGSLLDQAARRPAYLPMQVVARRDTTAIPQRLIAVDKAALPAGASIDKASGAIATPLPAAATSIAGITKNGAAFANGGQFALANNSLVINPGLIAQPASGVIDTYVITLNNADGGTTLATVLVSHGSVKIDSITLVTVAADTTPDAFVFGAQSGVALSTLIQSSTIMVSGINAAAPISISGGEYAIDGGAWSSAPGTVSTGQAVKVRHTTAAGNSAQTTTTLTIGGVSAGFVSTTLAAVAPPPPPVDQAPVVNAPSGTATNTSVTETNQIGDADGVRNITYTLYQNDGATLVGSNATGVFTGLTASTSYKMKTTAETYNPATATWTLQTSPLVGIATAATPDTTAPTTTAGPSVSGTTDTATTLSAIINEAGTGYYLVQPAATAAPSVAAVQAGTSFAMTANVAATPAISGLMAATAYNIYFVAKDAANNVQAAVQSVAVTTGAAQVPPVMGDVPNQAGSVNSVFNLALSGYVTLTNGDAIASYAIASGSLPPGLSLNTGTGAISGTPTTAGTYNVTVTASDNDGASNADAVQFVIAADVTPPAAPTGLALDSGAATTTGTSVTLDGLTTPPDADLAAWFVTESASVPAAGDAGWSSTRPTSYTFATATNQTKTVCVYVKDTANNVQATGSCDTIDKVAANTAPTGPALADASRGDRGGALSIDSIDTATGVTDADGDTLTYGATGLPGGLSIDPSSGVISGTIDVNSTQTYTVTVTVSDGHGGSLVRSFTLTITDQG